LRIGIDLMGSDSSPDTLYQAVLQIAEEFDAAYTLNVLATKDVVDSLSKTKTPLLQSPRNARIEFTIIDEVILMSDDPLTAVRRKKGSSLVIGIKLLKKRALDCFISTGNTGALIASATLSLPTLPGITRPALMAMLPTETGHTVVLDVGGSVYCKAHHLVQYAYLGAAYQRVFKGTVCPKVGLLNIGTESKKGTGELRQAYQSLEEHARTVTYGRSNPPFVFSGNVEGRDLFRGALDVVVTDGFTGNILLKSAEGVAHFIFDVIRKSIEESSSPKLEHALQHFGSKFNYAEYPGAFLCGLDGIVIKCHGNSSSRALYNGIKGAIRLVQQNVNASLKQQLKESLLLNPVS